MPKRVGARHVERASPQREALACYMLTLLHAKAQVCDAYRAWLEAPNQLNRADVSAALTTLARLENEHANTPAP